MLAGQLEEAKASAAERAAKTETEQKEGLTRKLEKFKKDFAKAHISVAEHEKLVNREVAAAHKEYELELGKLTSRYEPELLLAARA